MKDAKRALYASYGEQGRKNNKNSRKKSGPSPGRGCHYVADCGNPGCGRCHHQFVRRFGNQTHQGAMAS